MRLVSALLLLFLSTGSIAQMVYVYNKTDSLPISQVLIYDTETNNSVQTDSKGIAEISAFKMDDLLTFQHPSFINITLSKQEIINNGLTIDLQEQIIQYEEVTIAASKWEQNKQEVPNEILSIDGAELKESIAQTSADLLEETGQVFVQKSQLGGGSPMLRGFAANRVLIVVDGVRMNNAIFRSGNLQNIINIDPNVLQEAEVVFGPGSVMYGSDALGGVMDFHTISPPFTDTLQVKGSSLIRYSSANNEKTGHLHLSLSSKRLSLLSSFSYSDYDDLKSGSNYDLSYGDFGKRLYYAERVNNEDILVPNSDQTIQKFSGFQQWNVVNKVRLELTDKLRMEYGLYLTNSSDIPRYDRLIQPKNGDSLRNAEWYYGPQKWSMHRLSLSHIKKGKLYNEALITLAYQAIEESRNDRRFGSNSLRKQFENVDVFTFNADFNKRLDKIEIYYGTEITHNQVQSSATRTDITTNEMSTTSSRYPDGGSKYNSAAAYISGKARIHQKLTVTSGLRYNRVALSGSSSSPDAINYGYDAFDIANSTLSGSIGLVYRPFNSSQFDFIGATGFRSPNIDDIGKVFEIDEDDNGTSIVVVPNPNLKPENTYNIELGWKQKIKSFVQFNIVGYYTYLTNAIVRGPIELNGSNTAVIDGVVSELRAQVNANEAVIYGGTANLRIEFPFKSYITSSFTLSEGSDLSSGEPLRHTTPNFGKTVIGYKSNKLHVMAYAEYNGNRHREDIPAAEIDDKDYLYAMHITNSSKDGSPGWITYNLKCTYTLNNNWQILAAVENIADLHYRPYSSGISAPGRNFIISARLTF